MVRALERGLALSDFEQMTVGMIIGFITTYNNFYSQDDEDDGVREATQADFDRW